MGRLIGEGAMGQVFLAKDLRHDRSVAIKVLRPETDTPSGRARFQREIATIATLRHPHVLPLIDSGEVDGLLYLITPYIDGETLRDRLDREPQLPIPDALSIARDVAEGLSEATRLGLVHRDIKPSNILLADGHAIIADLGVARAIGDVDQRLSSTGMMIGTPLYMSPEQVSGERDVDGRSDIYSLACVVYEMLAGDPPFTAKRMPALIAKHVMEPPPDLSVVRPSVSDSIAGAIEKGLSKSPSDRQATALEFAHDLTDGDVRRSVARERTPQPVARLTTLGVAGWVVVAAALVGLGASVLMEERGSAHAGLEFVVLPYVAPGTSAEAAAELAQAEAELSRLLAGWTEVRTVPGPALAAMRSDLGVALESSLSLQDALAVARAAGVGTLVSLERSGTRGGVRFSGQRYSVDTSQPVGQPVFSDPGGIDLTGQMAPIAAELLGVRGDPNLVPARKRETASLTALRSAVEGLDYLRKRRLARAEASIRSALAADSLFSSAHYLLALTLYWQGADNGLLYPALGGEIRRHLTAARRGVSVMPQRDSLAVESFFSFQNGDYAAARSGYGRLTRSDSTDTFAWLLLGVVEYMDPWAAAGSDGAFRPVGSWNLATDAFTRAVSMEPDFYLGFGHLFDIYGKLTAAAQRSICYGYEVGRGQTLLPWEAGDGAFLCPVVGDSIEFLRSLDDVPRAEVIGGLERFMDRAGLELERWAEFAPESPWPRKLLSRWVTIQADLQIAGGSRAPWSDLLADALDHSERALALTEDTVPSDLIEVANVRLAVGDVAGAVTAVEQATERLKETGPRQLVTLPQASANPMMAAGRVRRAVELAADPDRARTLRIQDDRGALFEVIGLGDVERLQVFGATGYRGPAFRLAVDALFETWAEAGYTEAQTHRLRAFMTHRLLPALALSPEFTAEWFDGWEPASLVQEALALVGSDPARAGTLLDGVLGAARDPDRSRELSYVAGVVALRLGRPEDAVTAFNAVGEVRALLDRFQPGWGLESLAQLQLGRAHEALGNASSAAAHYARFVALWSGSDESVSPLLDEAAGALTRLR